MHGLTSHCAQPGRKKAQRGRKEAQWGRKEVQQGRKEAQRGRKEAQQGRKEAQQGRKEAHSAPGLIMSRARAIPVQISVAAMSGSRALPLLCRKTRTLPPDVLRLL